MEALTKRGDDLRNKRGFNQNNGLEWRQGICNLKRWSFGGAHVMCPKNCLQKHGKILSALIRKSSATLTATMWGLQVLAFLFWGTKVSQGLFQLVDIHLQFCFTYFPERAWCSWNQMTELLVHPGIIITLRFLPSFGDDPPKTTWV